MPHSQMPALLTTTVEDVHSQYPQLGLRREWRVAQDEGAFSSHTLRSLTHTMEVVRELIRAERAYAGGAGNTRDTDEEQKGKDENAKNGTPSWLFDDWVYIGDNDKSNNKSANTEEKEERYEESRILFDNCRVLISYIKSMESCDCSSCIT